MGFWGQSPTPPNLSSVSVARYPAISVAPRLVSVPAHAHRRFERYPSTGPEQPNFRLARNPGTTRLTCHMSAKGVTLASERNSAQQKFSGQIKVMIQCWFWAAVPLRFARKRLQLVTWKMHRQRMHRREREDYQRSRFRSRAASWDAYACFLLMLAATSDREQSAFSGLYRIPVGIEELHLSQSELADRRLDFGAISDHNPHKIVGADRRLRGIGHRRHIQ